MKIRSTTVWAASLLLAMVATGVWADGNFYYVSTNGTSTAPYDNWDNAFTNLQEALDFEALQADDTIYVAGQTFALDAQLIWTTEGVAMIGGFAATNALEQPGVSDPRQWPTVITRSGVATHRILFINGADNSTLKNVRLTGGNAHGGTGLRIENSSGVLITGCIIDENAFDQGSTAILSGGGIFLAAGSEALITNSTVRNNIARNGRNAHNGHAQGGGIWSGGDLTIIDSRILNNATLCENDGSIQTRGGGLYSAGPTLTMKNVLIAGNYARFEGGGLYVAGGDINLDHVTVAENPGDGIYQIGGSVAVSNSIVWGNWNDINHQSGTLTVSYSNVGDQDLAGNNLNADPLFEYGYYLATGSPCTNAGSDTATALGMGAYAKNTAGEVYDETESVNLGFHYPTGFDLAYADIYVATDGDNSNSGTNALEPIETLTHALTLARDGTRIHVATGAYSTASNEVFPLTVSGVTGLEILGAAATNTIIDASGSGERVMNLIHMHRLTLRGLSVRGGSARQGSGLFFDKTQNARLLDCRIVDNSIEGSSANNLFGGAGIFALHSGITLTDCLVANNDVNNRHTSSGIARGGGLWGDGALSIRNSEITGNNAISLSGGTGRGGGVYFDGVYLRMKNVLLNGNMAFTSGEGLEVAKGRASIENCTIVDNDGEGIRRDGGTVAVTNSILWNNGVDSTGTVTIAWSIIENSSDYTDGGNNLGSDPLFVDAAGGNYRLQRGSPAIDTGLNQPWMIGATDLDGLPRILKGTVDRGCYELIPPAGSLFFIR